MSNIAEVRFFKKKKYRFFSERWHWRIQANNGEVVARSTEGFRSRGNAEDNAMLTKRALNKHFEDRYS